MTVLFTAPLPVLNCQELSPDMDRSWHLEPITHTLNEAGRPVTPLHWQISVASSTDEGVSWDVPPEDNSKAG